MHQRTGKKVKFFFYGLLIVILTSINNYNIIYKNIFNVKYIYVNGFSNEKNELIKKNIQKIYEKNIFFLNKDYLENFF